MSKNLSNNIYVNSGNMVENRSTDSFDEENSNEDIYMNIDVLESTMKRTEKGTMTSGGHNAGTSCSRLGAVCLGLLCVLLLAAITVLWVKFTAERDQLQTRYNNLTIEKDQLQTRYNNLTLEKDQLQTRYNNLNIEKDQLQTRYNNLTLEKDQLQTRYNNLNIEKDQLQTRYNNLTLEKDQLQTRYNNLTVAKMLIQMERDELHRGLSLLGWSYFNFSIYNITTEKKLWNESRNDCRQRGADLVIINSKEEQEFISKTFSNTEAWIGLSDQDKEGTWKWVDSKPLTTSYWWKMEPNDYGGNEDCVITGHKRATDSLLTWADYYCNFPVFGICEIVLVRQRGWQKLKLK